MNYAVLSNHPFVSKKELKTKRVLTEQYKEMRHFFDTHIISVHEDAETESQPIVKVVEREVNEE